MMEDLEKRATFQEHWNVLRKVAMLTILSVVTGFAFSFYFHQELLSFIVQTIVASIPRSKGDFLDQQFYIFSPLDGLSLAFRVSLWFGLIVSSPVWSLLIASFVYPALLVNEKKTIVPIFFSSLLFLIGGICLNVFLLLPFIFRFLWNFNRSYGENFWALDQTIDIAFMLFFGSLFAFQLISFVFVLIRISMLSYHFFLRQRKSVVVIILILSAILTPPDIFSQLFVAIPLYGFFELALLMGKIKHSSWKLCKTSAS